MITGETDLFLDASGRLQLETDAVIAAAIKLRTRLVLFKGEWWADTRIGVPYFDAVFVKNPDIELIRRMIRRIILSCPPIVTVKKLDVYYLPSERICALEFQAVAEDGRLVTGGFGQPFIVELDSGGEVTI